MAPAPALLQSITIPRTETRSTPSPAFTVYAILVTLPVRNWTVYRRYSEFLALHQSFGDRPPPVPFPPKHVAKSTLKVFTAGLSGLLGGGNEEEIQRERKEGLERYLKTIVASPEATWRETDAFKDFIELPRSTPLSVPSGSGSASNGGVASRGGTTGTTSYRQQSHAVHGSYVPPSASSYSTTRRLGRPAPAQETDETRPLDDASLLASQQSQFDRQDAQLDSLAAILRRQKQMGMAINQELVEQNELLDTLDGEVQNTQSKMKKNESQIRRLG
ncbi:Phox-like protein [Microstroma glucosiphilum]|uniref:Phox-like protein n=1 Tax=Pseudomicrostroma glucosiphilum TaxID=1684307 RepID=A0A316UF61_9BASI|nr:Phox-like protein [Pseudomicrostroma glucosiphilum]PWN23896.1 Phox-like protein [Pseudomicrostroma glucosiphilum]